MLVDADAFELRGRHAGRKHADRFAELRAAGRASRIRQRRLAVQQKRSRSANCTTSRVSRRVWTRHAGVRAPQQEFADCLQRFHSLLAGAVTAPDSSSSASFLGSVGFAG